jgi:hypothetical protein
LRKRERIILIDLGDGRRDREKGMRIFGKRRPDEDEDEDED